MVKPPVLLALVAQTTVTFLQAPSALPEAPPRRLQFLPNLYSGLHVQLTRCETYLPIHAQASVGLTRPTCQAEISSTHTLPCAQAQHHTEAEETTLHPNHVRT